MRCYTVRLGYKSLLPKGIVTDAQRSCPRKRAVRSSASPLQADDRENGPAHRASRPGVLRKADLRAQAQAGRGGQAPLQAPAQPTAAAEALLARARHGQSKGEAIRPFCFERHAMSLKTRITDDMKDAMRAKAAARLSTIRLLLAAIKQKEVDERVEVSDADVVAIIERMIKQRRESVTQFEAGKRPDLVAHERAEIDI